MCLPFVVCCRGCSLSFAVVVDMYCCVMSMLLFVVVVRCLFAVWWLVLLVVVFVDNCWVLVCLVCGVPNVSLFVVDGCFCCFLIVV